jgi:hypothetical protein
MTSTRVPVAESAAALAGQQARVAVLLSRALRLGGWTAGLHPAERAGLFALGHFPEYADELDWTAREVAGHLRDSAHVFAERIERVRAGRRPLLPDFVPSDPLRVAGYRSAQPPQLLAELDAAQGRLLAAVEDVDAAELGREGVHETDGVLTLGDLLAFLPGHQRDHAEQLAALARSAGPAAPAG